MAAQEGGADRVELNAALDLGGLTPSLGSLIEARAALTIPIIAMLRPRPGGFCYSPSEDIAQDGWLSDINQGSYDATVHVVEFENGLGDQ